MNTTTNTTKKTKRPYVKTGKYSRKGPPARKNNAHRVSAAVNTMLELTEAEREIVIGLFN